MSILSAIVGGLVWAADWNPAFPAPPLDTQPEAQKVWVMCTVTDQGLSSNCRFYEAILGEAARLAAGTELGYLDAHPFPIPGATPGTEVKVLVRLILSKLPNGEYEITTPLSWFSSSSGTEITNAQWIVSPHDKWITGFSPDRAWRMHQYGIATVRCVVGGAGELLNCWVQTEKPTGWGFGEAAGNLLTHARMKSETATGEPTVGRPFTETFVFRGTDISWSN